VRRGLPPLCIEWRSSAVFVHDMAGRRPIQSGGKPRALQSASRIYEAGAYYYPMSGE